MKVVEMSNNPKKGINEEKPSQMWRFFFIKVLKAYSCAITKRCVCPLLVLTK